MTIIERWGENSADDYDNGTHDSYIQENQGTTNKNGQQIAIRGNVGLRQDGLFGFTFKSDLVSLGLSESDIFEAKLYCKVDTIVGGDVTLNLHRTTSTFNEATVTWNSRPGYDGSVSASNNHPVGSAAGNWFSYDVTAFVRRVLSGTLSETGFYLRSPDNDSHQVTYDDSEHADGDRPYLRIEYAVGVVFDDSVSDGITFSDSASGQMIFAPSAYDGFTFSDSVSAELISAAKAAVDGIVFTDVATAQVEFSPSAVDIIIFSDSASGAYEHFSVDGIIFSDSATIQVEFAPSAFDGISLSDESSATQIISLSASDGILIGDVSSSLHTLFVSASDGIIFSDESTPELFPNASDGVTFSDSASAVVIFNVLAEDGIIFSDPAGATFAGSFKTIYGKNLTLTFKSVLNKK